MMATTPGKIRPSHRSMRGETLLRRVYSQHRSITRQVRELMRLLDARPADDEAGERRGEVLRRIRRLQRDLARHFADEEKVGFLRHAVEVAPRLSRRARAIASEHARLRIGLEELANLAQRELAPWAELRFAFQAFSAELEVHEDRENELIDEAFLDDLGVSG